MDADDPLRALRAEFCLPTRTDGTPQLYFCGHSLGLQPRRARALVAEELDAWEQLGVEAHFNSRRPWLSYHERLAPGLAELAGASEREVVAMNSLTVNLHLLLASFYRPTSQRYKILIEAGAFPSDRYAVVSQLQFHRVDPADGLLQIAPRGGESSIRIEDIQQILEREGPRIATVLLPGVQYLSGQRLDMQAIAARAHTQGCRVGFDLAHAIGNVPLSLHDWNVDFAVWCGYKYLNGGPGAIGGAFVHERHAHAFDLPRLAGWWGHDKASRFAMPDSFAPQPGAEGWQVSNPPILAMAPLLASLETFQRASMSKLHVKSIQLTTLLARLLREHLPHRVDILTPTEPDAHGSQLSLRVDTTAAEALRSRLLAAGIICDWREPNVLRVAPVPLYNTFREVWTLANALAEILA